MFLKQFIVVWFLALGSCFCFAQTIQPVKWEFSYNPIDETKGELILKANIGLDWHIYSQLQSGDGPLPTIFKFELTPDYDLVDKVKEPDPVIEFSTIFSADVMSFSNEVVFKQKIKRTNKNAFTIMGHVECMACNNTQCLPPKEYKFTISVPSAN
ncbi:MAG TPA: protein-disulfide reductase DsbD domain-containing protein [Bacteroidia bacterium]